MKLNFLFFIFECNKILEMQDITYKGIVCALHNEHSTILAGMFVLIL
jgi:hypothetical protein